MWVRVHGVYWADVAAAPASTYPNPDFPALPQNGKLGIGIRACNERRVAEPGSVSSQTGQTEGTERARVDQRERTSASDATSARPDHTVTYFFVVTQSYAHFYIDDAIHGAHQKQASHLQSWFSPLCRVDWSRPAPAPVDLFAISSLTRIRGYGKDIPGNFEILGYPEDIPGFGYPRIILICFSD